MRVEVSPLRMMDSLQDPCRAGTRKSRQMASAPGPPPPPPWLGAWSAMPGRMPGFGGSLLKPCMFPPGRPSRSTGAFGR